MEKIRLVIANRQGSILIESLTGIAIMAVVLVGFVLVLTSSTKLALEAEYDNRISEQLAVGIENGKYTTPAAQGSAFQITMYLYNVNKDNIILADDSKLISKSLNPGDIMFGAPGSLGSAVQLVTAVKFSRYTDKLPAPLDNEANLFVLRKW